MESGPFGLGELSIAVDIGHVEDVLLLDRGHSVHPEFSLELFTCNYGGLFWHIYFYHFYW